MGQSFSITQASQSGFRASQVFFPRTGAWDSLRKALKADYDESVWDHLAGTRSAPFEAGEQGQIAIKVIDDRGETTAYNETHNPGDKFTATVTAQGSKARIKVYVGGSLVSEDTY